jgi:ubiquinone/menaquinone biosynthesis C-methylase UbiE
MTKQYHTTEDIQQGYNRWASSYDQTLVGGWQYRAPLEVAEKLSPLLRPEMKMLDMACGTGLNTEQYSEQEVVGVDFSDGMLEQYRVKGFQAVKGDIYSLPFRDDSFDVAVCTSALENYPDVTPILAEAKRVVKEGGLISFTVCLSDMEGCYQVTEEEIDQKLATLGLRKIDSFDFLSHYEYGQEDRPMMYLGVTCLNSKMSNAGNEAAH